MFETGQNANRVWSFLVLSLAPFLSRNAMVSSSLLPVVREELATGNLVLNSGRRMPRLGMGTAEFGHSTQVPEALVTAIKEHGVRMLDTAQAYANEEAVAGAVAASGVPRSEMFYVTKLWPFIDYKGKDRVKKPAAPAWSLEGQLDAHLRKLNTSYADLGLLHWPTPRLREHWDVMIQLQEKGKLRSIGLSNSYVSHLESLRDARLQPDVVQTELAPVRADRRLDAMDLEQLVNYCNSRGIILQTHSPFKGALKNQNAIAVAATQQLTVPRLLVRYSLQRGFSVVFGSRNLQHIKDNLDVFSFELDVATMRSIACWRQEAGCHQLPGAVAVQCNNGKHCLHHMQQTLGYSHRYLVVEAPVAEKENDPIVDRGSPGWGTSNEMRSSPRVEVSTTKMSPLGSIYSIEDRDTTIAGCTDPSDHRAYRRNCDFHLELAGAGRDGGLEFDNAYRDFIVSFRKKAVALLESDSARWAIPPQKLNESTRTIFRGAQHVQTAKDLWHLDPSIKAEHKHFLTRYLQPYLARRVFGHNHFKMSRGQHLLSRNHYVGETVRTRSMLWHWDTNNPHMVKVILYLNDVDHRNGCMVAMLHNETGRRIKLKWGAQPFGRAKGADFGGPIPKPWISELLSGGYRGECLSGPAGTLVVFDTNVIHRGSRPAPGNYRDFILFGVHATAPPESP